MGDVEQRCASCGTLLSIGTEPWIKCVACNRYNNVPLVNRRRAFARRVGQ